MILQYCLIAYCNNARLANILLFVERSGTVQRASTEHSSVRKRLSEAVQRASRSLRPCNRIPVAMGTLNESTPSSIPIRIRCALAWIVASDTPVDSFPNTQHQECDTYPSVRRMDC
jgi:hypothetical protein